MKAVLTTFFLLVCLFSLGQLQVDPAYSVNQLVLQKLLGSGVTVSNIVYRGDSLQRGFFDGSNSNIGIDSGIVLMTGIISDAIGPNNSDGSNAASIVNNFNDPDIEKMVNAGKPPANYDSSYDIASLEFDFVSTSDSISFNFVFGSEEYLEFVNTSVNDAFGFFLSGPGISGPFSNNAINLAKVPGTTTFISIDSVNNVVNSSFFIDNGTGASMPQLTDTTVVQFDGFTTKIGIQQAIQCNQTYHIKIVVADIGDKFYNSAVFLEGKTFQSTFTKPTISIIDDKDTICLGDSIFININTASIRIKSFSPNTLPIAPGIYKLTPTNYHTTYTVIFEDTTACGVIYEDTNTLDVIVQPPLQVDFSSDSVCLGDSSSIVNLTSGFARSSLWDFGNGSFNNIPSSHFKHLFTNSGNHLVKLKTITSHFCQDSIQKTIYVKPRSIPDFNIHNICQFDSILPNNISTFPSGSVSSLTWNWNFGDGNTSNLSDPSNQYLLPGQFLVSLTSTTPEGCSDTVTKNIIVNPKPSAHFSADTVCFEHITTFTNLSTGNIIKYEWTPKDIPTLANPTYIFDSSGIIPVTLKITSDSGCIDSTSLPVVVHHVPLANFSYSPDNIYIFDTDVCFQNQSKGATTYRWNFGFQGVNNTSNVIHPCPITFPNQVPAIYQTKLYASNDQGCIDSISQDIEIIASYILYLPNAFTPNNDKLNDTYLPVTEGISDYQFQIFNRWGEIIFESEDRTQGWDGTYKGKQVKSGVYVYKISILDFLGNPVIKTGHISLIR